MSNPIIQHLEALRQEMKVHHIDLYVQPSTDPHLSEYVADRYKSRAFLTGFNGSAGTAIITQEKAVLFTDGRYFIQAEKALDGSTIELMKMATEGYPTMAEWILNQSSDLTTIGFDGRLFSHSEFILLKKQLQARPFTFITTQDLVKPIWAARPSLPKTQVFLHALEYTGDTALNKLTAIRQAMQDYHADTYVMNALNDIAWLFNIRGNDIAYTPVVYAYAIITASEALLFLHDEQVNAAVRNNLLQNGVTLRPYEDYYTALLNMADNSVLFDPNKTNALMITSLASNNQLIECVDPTYMMKASLNPTEKENLVNAQIRDGIAMVNFLHWFDQNVNSGTMTECEAELQLEAFRSAQPLFIEPSFRTIPAYGPNGAMMHYSTQKTNSDIIHPKGLFLLDSGGQYYDGTTDITRTMAAGPISKEEIRDFTLVVKGHIRLNQLIFLKGVTGTNIDIIARQCMWENYMDYKSGTGHSIGYLLGVHEGPARIKKESTDVILVPGMLLTNEPGIYKEGHYGIRIENTLVVEELAQNDTGTYLGFDVISYCPIDHRCIDPVLLSAKELKWLNDYHQKVYRLLSPHLSEEVSGWLKEATRTIGKTIKR